MMDFTPEPTQGNEVDCNEKPKMFKQWFNMNVTLNHLVLRNCSFSQIEADAFNQKQFQVLHRLDIESVPLEILNEGAFNGLPRLQFMQLVGLKLRTFGEKLLKPLKILQFFFLRECGDNKISLDNLFSNVTLNNLKLVSIKQCKLGDTITKTTFSGLKSLNKLVLVSNEIEKIGANALDSPMISVSILDMSSNRLTSLPKNVFKTNRKDKISIDLRSNDWHCDCSMEHMRQLVQSDTKLDFSEIVCKSPENLENFHLKHCSPLCSDKPLASVTLSSNTEKWKSVCSSPIAISRPEFKRPLAGMKNGELHFAIDELTNNFMIIDFQQDRSTIAKDTCRAHLRSEEKDLLSIEKPVIPEKLYRICWMRKSFGTIMPANCVSIFAHPKIEDTGSMANAWILRDQMGTMIGICFLLCVLAFAFGLLIAYGWARFCREKSLGPKLTLTRTPSEQLRQQEMIERLKWVSILF